MSMSLSQARVVDPVLTTHAQGYKNADFVGMALFPRVDVAKSGGQVIEFGREAFVRCRPARTGLKDQACAAGLFRAPLSPRQ